MSKPTITTHYADGRESEIREMTDEEYAQYEADIANAEPLPSPE
jgi:hypothetical protein